MQVSSRLLAILFVFWLGVLPAWADAQDLYSATVPVLSRSTPDRTAALTQALRHVLIKVSGESNLNSYPKIDETLKKATSMISQYRYEKGENDMLQLWASFDPDSVNLALLSAGLPVWDHYRPINLFWVGVDLNGRRYIVSENDDRDELVLVRETITQYAKDRGMQVIFPIGDLSDDRAVSASDIWGGFMQPIQKASKRYEVDGLIVLKLTRNSQERWSGQWDILIGKEQAANSLNGAVLQNLLKDVVNEEANLSARVYAKAEDHMGKIQLVVTDLNDVQAYAKVYAYLRQMKSVSDVQLAEFAIPTVTFDVKLAGRLTTFEKNLALDGVLMANDPSEPSRNDDRTVTYRYVPDL